MKVIHYITDFTGKAGPMTTAAKMMIASTAKVAENHIITCVPLQDEYVRVLLQQYNTRVHMVKPVQGRNPITFRMFESEIQKVVKEVQPDVMHVHGAWDFMAAMAEWKARHCNVVTVVSPHRALSQEIINIDFWNKKLIRLLAYQIWMVRNCTAVIAVNEKEKDDITSLGLKKRIEVMANMPKELEAAGPLRDSLMAAYRKALDSTYFKRITAREKDFVYKTVRAAVIDSDAERKVPEMQALSFRNIFFHAYDEDVTELMLQGVQKLGLTIPPTLDVAMVPRYKNAKAKRRGSINEASTSKKIALQPDMKMETVAVEQIAKSNGVGMKRLTLRHYMELYQLLRHTDFNEDIVAAELRRLGLRSYTRKLQKKLHDMFDLKPGYDIY